MKTGDHVTKIHGYPFPGVIVALFTKLDGEERVVVESTNLPGLLHIFAPHQIKTR